MFLNIMAYRWFSWNFQICNLVSVLNSYNPINACLQLPFKPFPCTFYWIQKNRKECWRIPVCTIYDHPWNILTLRTVPKDSHDGRLPKNQQDLWLLDVEIPF
jgi:hypothetical protein